MGTKEFVFLFSDPLYTVPYPLPITYRTISETRFVNRTILTHSTSTCLLLNSVDRIQSVCPVLLPTPLGSSSSDHHMTVFTHLLRFHVGRQWRTLTVQSPGYPPGRLPEFVNLKLLSLRNYRTVTMGLFVVDGCCLMFSERGGMGSCPPFPDVGPLSSVSFTGSPSEREKWDSTPSLFSSISRLVRGIWCFCYPGSPPFIFSKFYSLEPEDFTSIKFISFHSFYIYLSIKHYPRW